MVTLLPLLSLFLSQACLPSALTFRRPCLRGTRWPKCHSKIYSCEHWLLERREGVCNQVERAREQMNLSIHWFSIISLSFLNFHLLLLPLISSHLLWTEKLSSLQYHPSIQFSSPFFYVNVSMFCLYEKKCILCFSFPSIDV